MRAKKKSGSRAIGRFASLNGPRSFVPEERAQQEPSRAPVAEPPPPNAAQIVTEGRLRFAVARDFAVRAQTPHGTFKLFKIMFGPDGSIYVPFPYLTVKRGLLAEVDPSQEPDPKTISLRRPGSVVVDYDVKFSHHLSGCVQFSKSGGTDLLPRRWSFRLDGPIGNLFVFNAFRLDGFAKTTKTKPKEMTLNLSFPQHPTSVQVAAGWFGKAEIEENMLAKDGIIGPDVTVIERATGVTKRCLLIGQPRTSPLQDHVVMLSAREVQMASGMDGSGAVFWGGYDPHEGKAPETPRMLVFQYPYEGA